MPANSACKALLSAAPDVLTPPALPADRGHGPLLQAGAARDSLETD